MARTGVSLRFKAVGCALLGASLLLVASGAPSRAEGILDFMVGPRPGGASIGGAIEAVADEDGVLLSEDSGVVIADPSVVERADIT